MKKGVLLWTFFCIAAYAVWSCWGTADLSHNSTSTGDVRFVVDGSRQRLLISSSAEIRIEAASSSFFVLWNEKMGEVISGRTAEKPLGWKGNEYYVLQPTLIEDGDWRIVDAKDLEIHLEAIDEMGEITVTEAYDVSGKFLYLAIALFVTILLWAFIFALIEL